MNNLPAKELFKKKNPNVWDGNFFNLNYFWHCLEPNKYYRAEEESCISECFYHPNYKHLHPENGYSYQQGKPSFIYVIEDIEHKGWFKIGISNDPCKRQYQLTKGKTSLIGYLRTIFLPPENITIRGGEDLLLRQFGGEANYREEIQCTPSWREGHHLITEKAIELGFKVIAGIWCINVKDSLTKAEMANEIYRKNPDGVGPNSLCNYNNKEGLIQRMLEIFTTSEMREIYYPKSEYTIKSMLRRC